ncbi:hypothetical protein LCGC14_0484980 [marine sediment metagenome]|uniref:Uncharacterized protein n=1 Tax=marine sediment metagenome TaxID=412755 RepID=A0A0F9S875_9ZZZZ
MLGKEMLVFLVGVVGLSSEQEEEDDEVEPTITLSVGEQDESHSTLDTSEGHVRELEEEAKMPPQSFSSSNNLPKRRVVVVNSPSTAARRRLPLQPPVQPVMNRGSESNGRSGLQGFFQSFGLVSPTLDKLRNPLPNQFDGMEKNYRLPQRVKRRRRMKGAFRI